MKRLTVIVALLLSVALLAGCGGLGSVGVGGGGRVSGLIKDEDGNFINDRKVTVTAGGRTTETETGSYTLTNVPVGPTTLVATAPGYEEFSEPINVTSGEVTKDITMIRVPATIEGQVNVPPANADAAVQLDLNLWQRALAMLRVPVVHASLTGEVPLPGATVKAYNWATGSPIGDPVTTEGNGTFSIPGIPLGTNVLIQVTKGSVRLSAIVPEVGESEMVDVNTVSTLTAETLGESFRQETIDLMEYQIVRNRIQTWLEEEVDINDIDLRKENGWIGETFGSSNLHQQLIAIRADEVTPLGEMAAGKRIVSTVRNLVPSLVAFGGPIVADATDRINNDVAPALAGVVDRVTIIAGLVEDAQLEPLEEGNFTFGDDDHTMSVTITDVEDGDNEKLVTTTFTVKANGAEEDFGSGEMVFIKPEGRPVTWMDLSATLKEEVDGKDMWISLDSEIQFTWADSLVNDLRDLKSITIGSGESADIDSTFMTGTGTLTAELDTVNQDDKTYVVVSSITFNGNLDIEGTLISGNFKYDLAPASLDEYELIAKLTIKSDDPAYDEFAIVGDFGASGVVFLEGETEDDYDNVTSWFKGTIDIPGRQFVSIDFDATRDKYFGLNLDNVVFTDGDLTLTGTVDIAATEAKPGEEKLFDTATIAIDLTDTAGYNLNVTGNLDGDNITATGWLTSPTSVQLAVIEPDGMTGARVGYIFPDGIEYESLF